MIKENIVAFIMSPENGLNFSSLILHGHLPYVTHNLVFFLVPAGSDGGQEKDSGVKRPKRHPRMS